MLHRRPLSRTLVACAALLSGVFVVLPATSATAGRAQDGQPSTTTTPLPPVGDNPQLSKEYNDALAEQAELQGELDTVQREATTARLKLAKLRTDTTANQLALLDAQEQYRRTTLLAIKRERMREAAERRTARAVERLRRQAVASYVRGGRTSVVEAFLAARNGEEAGQALAYGNAAVGSTDSLVRSLRRAQELERKASRAAAKARRQATKHRDEIKAATDFLRTARDRQQQLVEQVDLKLLAVNSKLIEVQTRGLLLEGRAAGNGKGDGIGGILATLQAGQPDYQVGAVDIQTPLPGKFPSSPFGIRYHPILHIWRLHAGCDIGAPQGLEIHAPADGVVVIAGTHGGYGNYTAIDHGSSLATGFGHQSQILVHVGQVVKKGEVIGLVGSTGLSTGAHLHFETRIKGVPVNPEGIIDFAAPFEPPA